MNIRCNNKIKQRSEKYKMFDQSDKEKEMRFLVCIKMWLKCTIIQKKKQIKKNMSSMET